MHDESCVKLKRVLHLNKGDEGAISLVNIVKEGKGRGRRERQGASLAGWYGGLTLHRGS
jgi:hypothetical protein